MFHRISRTKASFAAVVLIGSLVAMASLSRADHRGSLCRPSHCYHNCMPIALLTMELTRSTPLKNRLRRC